MGKNQILENHALLLLECLNLAIVLSMIPDVVYEKIHYHIRFLPYFLGLRLDFRVDAFGLLFAMGASLLWIATSIYSIGYMRSTNEQSDTLFCLFCSCTYMYIGRGIFRKPFYNVSFL